MVPALLLVAKVDRVKQLAAVDLIQSETTLVPLHDYLCQQLTTSLFL